MENRVLYHESVYKGLVEDLETRIAPAVFVMSGGTVFDAEGNDATTAHQDEADSVGATKAVLLKKGDSLIVDTDGDGKFTKDTDTLIAQIKGGGSLMFFTDMDGMNGIDADEISGLAVSNKFGGLLNANVHGDIATLLSSDFTLNTNQFAAAASISKLTINGFVERSIAASGAISGLTINSTEGDFSVDSIFTGDATGDEFQAYMGDAELAITPSEVSPKSTSISKVSLHGGVDTIHAGGNYGKGGSVTGITITNTINDSGLFIVAGDGFSGKKAGSGGSISAVVLQGESFNEISIVSGSGGDGNLGEGLSGAVGGSIKKVSIVSGADHLEVVAGDGGNGTYEYVGDTFKAGSGGAGGSVSGLVVSQLGVNKLDMVAGSGGEGFGKLKGGAGGKISTVTALISGNGTAAFFGGDGGMAEKSGGTGGSISGIKFLGEDITSIELNGGNGGTSQGAPYITGPGGAGGGISKISVMSGSADAGVVDTFAATGGAGGNSSYFYNGYTYRATGGAGGAGGSIKSVVISSIVSTSLDATGGAGGNSTFKFDGAKGGAVQGVKAAVDDLQAAVLTGGLGGTGDAGFYASDGPQGVVSGNTITQAQV